MVEAHGVHKAFGATEVLRGVDLEVEEGAVACLIGPSGSGKSTFLRCINRLETIDAGAIVVDGALIGHHLRGDHLVELGERHVARNRMGVGMVFQRFNLFPHMTALGNVMCAPRTVLGARRDEARRAALDLLDQVGLADRAHHYPAQLSGGQQQRVAIARALAMRPKLMLFDEPTSALDPELVGEVLAVMRDLARSGMTMVVVTHEIAFAREIASTISFLDDGVVVEQGTPTEVFDQTRNARTREFLAAVL
ncbi:MAG: amino acid ABC transporter ATP-binding protein [Actinobacteria bacterium]|nr:amino acid ABC transporter ATP-binding protein [Actinomycetota bacterium]